ncbi:hypothetical protein DSECCO2_488060 [anaerobic digester metagenome]
MSYTEITSRRIPYDIDGTVVGYGNGVIPTSWLNSTQSGNLNNSDTGGVISNSMNFWFFFPEKREIECAFIAGYKTYTYGSFVVGSITGSNDTTNGQDGTWETATFPNGSPAKQDPSSVSWRELIKTVSFSEPKRVLKVNIYNSYWDTEMGCSAMHFYGRKAFGETPDDILFCDTDGVELTALDDWGDRPEGTTATKSFKAKNASTTKIANGVNLQLNHADFGLSFSESGPWTATLDITSIAANSLSATIYARNLLGPPLLTLGPKFARCIATVGSWT